MATKGLELVGHQNKADVFQPNNPGGLTYANSDLAFGGHYVYQGNFSGLQVWDNADPTHPSLAAVLPCFTEQGDVSLSGHLLFVSAENRGSRLDCSSQMVTDSVSKDRMLGIRIFDVSDPRHPKQVADVQTCRGSHTNTLVPDTNYKGVVYIYVSGLAPLRSTTEMAGCQGATSPTRTVRCSDRGDPGAARTSRSGPHRAHRASSPTSPRHSTHGVAYADTAHGATMPIPRRFLPPMPSASTAADTTHVERLFSLLVLERSDSNRVRMFSDSLSRMGVKFHLPEAFLHPSGPSQCHDITVYRPWGRRCVLGIGLLLDIKDPAHPQRLQAVSELELRVLALRHVQQ